MNFNQYYKEKKQGFIEYRAVQLFHEAETDPILKAEAINHLCRLLSFIPDQVKQEMYVVQLAKDYKIKTKTLTGKLKELNQDIDEFVILDDEESKLPTHVDPKEFRKYGFYEHKNEYHFKTSSGVRRISNFIMEPLIHIRSVNDAKRLYKLINKFGASEVLELDMNAMVSLTHLRRAIESVGNYIWEGTEAQFSRLKSKLYEETQTGYRIDNLGWQKQGFFAFANGICKDGNFEPVDEYGVIVYNEKNYFIPAFSSIYMDDKSVYINERKFVYIKNNIKFKEWAVQFIEVFGDNAKIAICYYVATLFRDFIFNTLNFFPLLNHFGPPGGGKSQMAISLLHLFGKAQSNINVNNVTRVAISEHIAEFNNAFAWSDEYQNDMDYDKIQILKSSYDGIGRKRGTIKEGRKTEQTKVDSAIILTGQQMTTADIALFERVIFLRFPKSEYTPDEQKKYDELKKIEQKGLSHLTLQILKYRPQIEAALFRNNLEIMTELQKELIAQNIKNRILSNVCVLISCFKTLETYIDFPFDYAEIKKIALNNIIVQNNEISNSNELAVFWEMIEYLVEDKMIEDGYDFKISYLTEITIDEKNKRNLGKTGKQILFLKFSRIYTLYAKHAQQSKQNILPSSTLKYYLKNSKEFLCTQNKTRFNNSTTSSYCFDYDLLLKHINLVRTKGDAQANSESTVDDFIEPVKEEEKLPF